MFCIEPGGVEKKCLGQTGPKMYGLCRSSHRLTPITYRHSTLASQHQIYYAKKNIMVQFRVDFKVLILWA